jgi:iron uptake system component EfeO
MKLSPIGSKLTVICLLATTIMILTPNQQTTKEAFQTSAPTAADIKAADLIAPIAAYKAYIVQEVEQLTAKTKTFTDAVIVGNLPVAQKLYAPTRVHWERSEPLSELFSDLYSTIDRRSHKFELKERDPKFVGWHRLEKILFQDKTTKGTKEIATQLMKDTLELRKRVGTLEIAPKTMIGGAALLIEDVATNKISGEEDRYSKTDLWNFSANIDGSQKIVELLRPVVYKANPKLLQQMDNNFAKVNAGLAKHKMPNGGYQDYDKIKDLDRQYLKAAIMLLAEDLSNLQVALDIE